jgi:hypothetical protein
MSAARKGVNSFLIRLRVDDHIERRESVSMGAFSIIGSS